MPFPNGVGVEGARRELPSRAPMLDRPSGEGEPKLFLRPLSRPPDQIPLWNSGLPEGVNGGLSGWLLVGESSAPEYEKGELPHEPELLLRELDDMRYLGGVMYSVPCVAGDVLFGSSPSSALCDGVSGMSDTWSGAR